MFNSTCLASIYSYISTSVWLKSWLHAPSFSNVLQLTAHLCKVSVHWVTFLLSETQCLGTLALRQCGVAVQWPGKEQCQWVLIWKCQTVQTCLHTAPWHIPTFHLRENIQIIKDIILIKYFCIIINMTITNIFMY